MTIRTSGLILALPPLQRRWGRLPRSIRSRLQKPTHPTTKPTYGELMERGGAASTVPVLRWIE
jgi:hypothetical protein